MTCVVRTWLCICVAGAVVTTTGCARAATTSVAGDRNLITSPEILQADVASAHDVIAKLRPQYLRSRGPNSLLLKQQVYATVFLDDTDFGALSTLRTIPASTISAIRFLEGSEATTKFGSQYVAGIIQIFSLSR